MFIYMSENWFSGCLTRSDLNRAVQRPNLARVLKFSIEEEEKSYFPCRKTKELMNCTVRSGPLFSHIFKKRFFLSRLI